MSDDSNNNQNSDAASNGHARPQIKLQLSNIPKPPTTAAAAAPSLVDLIDEEVSAVEAENPSPEGAEGFLKEMTCINCGLLADIDMDVPSCACPDCGGTMYPSEADNDRTISYLEASDDDEGMEDSVEMQGSASGMQSIKVAQPVNVGMFTGSTNNPTSSSQQIKGIDFLSSSSSSASGVLRVTESQKNLQARISELEITVKNLEEEKAELKQQRTLLETAIADFNEKRKAFEQYRLEFELKTQTTRGPSPLNLSNENINMAQTVSGFNALSFLNDKKGKVMLIIIAAMGVMIMLQTLGLIIFALKK